MLKTVLKKISCHETNSAKNVTEKKCDKKCDIFVTKLLVQKMSHFISTFLFATPYQM